MASQNKTLEQRFNEDVCTVAVETEGASGWMGRPVRRVITPLMPQMDSDETAISRSGRRLKSADVDKLVEASEDKPDISSFIVGGRRAVINPAGQVTKPRPIRSGVVTASRRKTSAKGLSESESIVSKAMQVALGLKGADFLEGSSVLDLLINSTASEEDE